AAHKRGEGAHCLDLTCGLGVDAYYLSKRFARVTTVERDEVLAAIARENFRRLGATNIEVVCGSAEEVVAAAEEGQFDQIYADPDRRAADGRRQVLLECCSPDVAMLMPKLQQLAPRVVIKNSPLFDVAEAERLFGERCRVEVVSLAGECKEVIAEWDKTYEHNTLIATAIGVGEFSCPSDARVAPTFATDPRSARYLLSPDVALRKARLSATYFAQTAPDARACTADGFYLAEQLPEGATLARVYEIVTVQPFAPKQLKRDLARRSIRRLTALKRDLSLSSSEICRRLGVSEGGDVLMAFTECGGEVWAIELKELTK
ncbi:MAG: methyltransferase domain-containing protein, partial [Rikenellaceae bacterium]|nr:methyltransferase domain-containing protein [Rikenellaceae bacterium]